MCEGARKERGGNIGVHSVCDNVDGATHKKEDAEAMLGSLVQHPARRVERKKKGSREKKTGNEGNFL